MHLNLLEIIVLFSGAFMLLLGCIFLFYPIGKKISNYFLAFFLLSNAVLLGNFFAYAKIPGYEFGFVIIRHTATYSYLLLAPFLYLYIVSLCRKNFQFKLGLLLHALPYLLLTVIAIVCSYLSEIPAAFWKNLYLIYKQLLFTQIALYMVISFVQLRKYRTQLNELYSNVVKIDLMWVNIMLFFFILMWVTDMLGFFLGRMHLISSAFAYFLLCLSISTDLILSVGLIYKGLIQATIPLGIESLPRYSQNRLDSSEYDANKKKLIRLMEKEKPYLQPELSLDELAVTMNIPPKHLSQTINSCFNLNFNNFINEFRVNEAKKLIETDSEEKKTLYAILFESGFNSKAVFNSSFKKFTGHTPKEYREKISMNQVLNPDSGR